ncbi:MAG: DNA polymerase III subunit gamma/tau [Bacteroidaceae bacterium]
MGNYIVSARKYRPATFDSVVGQSVLTQTLKNAIHSGKLAHAYLFCGPRGVGKTTCARIFAKTINCFHPKSNGEACDECESCMAFNEQRSFNIHELDAASNNSVDEMRTLCEQVRILPQVGRYKVFIIDEVHMLSSAAFNAFLKTLEEPPAHVIFILATTEKHKILPTILSRCQIYDFNLMEVADIVEHLKNVAQKEQIKYEEAALNVIAQKADGGMRDALSIFDQVVSFTEGDVAYQKVIENLNVLDYEYYFQLTDSFLAHEVSKVMLTLNEILSKGFEGNHFIGGLASHFRDLLISRDEATIPLLEVSQSVKARYQEQAKKCQPKFLYRAIKLCNDCSLNYKVSQNKRLLIEITLIEVAQISPDDEVGNGPSPIKKLKPLFTQNRQQAQPVVIAKQPKPIATVQPLVSEPATPYVANPTPTALTPPTSTAQPSVATSSFRTLGTPSIKLKKSSATNVPTQTSATPQITTPQNVIVGKSETFDHNNLNFYWHKFANSLPKDDAAIAGRMKNMVPQLVSETTFSLTVDNEQVKEYFASYTSQIETYLRQALNNNSINMTILVTEKQESARAYSPREQFNAMLESNEHLVKLKQLLELELT